MSVLFLHIESPSYDIKLGFDVGSLEANFLEGILTRLTLYSLGIMSICNFSCFSLWFRGQGFIT